MASGDTKNRSRTKDAGLSRRNFIAKAAAGAGAAAGVLVERTASAADTTNASGIKIPVEFAQAAKIPAAKAEFPMNGAQVFARACKEEGLAALFSCPGNYSIVNAIALEGIPTYSGRHEGAMCHAAVGFCRVTGQIAAASGTEGPGFTNMINADAGRDHWPNVAGALLAGGGMPSGQVLGSTTRWGEEPHTRPIHFRDVFATLYERLGIDVATTQFTDLAGRPQYLVGEHRPLPELIG